MGGRQPSLQQAFSTGVGVSAAVAGGGAPAA